jgi:hypothetical protein
MDDRGDETVGYVSEFDDHGWEEIGWTGVDAATVAFGAATTLGDDFRLSLDTALTTRGTPPGYDNTLVLQNTREDCSLPVEIVPQPGALPRAARMCFTDDVDDLQGTWTEIGQLTLLDGRCVASDPYCGGPFYRFYFDLTPGRYVAEAFDFEGDVLGLRIRLGSPSGDAHDRRLTASDPSERHE